jgi:hypothetical protein
MTEIGEKTTLPLWLQESIREVSKIHDDYLRQFGVNVRQPPFNAKGDGGTDDSVILQNAIDYCITNKLPLYIPNTGYNYNSLTNLNVTSPLTIISNHATIAFVNCDGFVFGKGVNGTRITGLDVAHWQRQTDVANTHIAFKYDGDDITHVTGVVMYDVSIDGFNTAIEGSHLWNCYFNKIEINYCLVGIRSIGRSVNNHINKCHISVGGLGSRGMVLGDGINPTEGWYIFENITYGAEKAITAFYCGNSFLCDNIFDFCVNIGVEITEVNGPSFNWTIDNNYIAMSGTTETDNEGGIRINNVTDNNQNRGHRIINNQILVYGGSYAKFGIQSLGSQNKYNVIKDNSINGFTYGDISISGGEKNIIKDNVCLSPITASLPYNIQRGTSTNNVISDNIGMVSP